MARQLHRQRPLRIRGRSYRLEVVGFASRLEPLVVGALIEQAKFVGLKGGGYEER